MYRFVEGVTSTEVQVTIAASKGRSSPAKDPDCHRIHPRRCRCIDGCCCRAACPKDIKSASGKGKLRLDVGLPFNAVRFHQ